MSRRFLTFLTVPLVAASVLVAAPAHARSSVTIDAGGKGAVIDSSYSTSLTVSGRGFQSIKGGHGGIYVWFGTVSPGWQPSRGGRSGIDYAYVPDSESKSNQGFQRFVSFPGSATASTAAATMSESGAWSTNLKVPGPTFQAVGRNGSVRTVDCRKVTCGVITVGAHGVRNANNETFTPVRLAELTPTSSVPSATSTTVVAPTTGATSTDSAADQVALSQGPVEPIRRGPAKLRVDRSSAMPGRALAFTVANLTPGRQFSVILDDGLSASGPFAAGPDGRASGAIALPADARSGTHELRLFGAGKKANVRFGLTAPAVEPVSAPANADDVDPAPRIFAGVALLAFLLALGFAGARALRSRRARV
ncbi:MAG: hypothetical protein V9G04_15320 [Nocardioides sp.]|jgi:hypothetical protein